jgi:Protein of unknown function (Hypoth_ymh)
MAVRDALTMLEISVREAGGFTNDDLGVDLMRKAFNSNTGPLTNHSPPENERKGYEHMFAGAIGALRTRTRIARLQSTTCAWRWIRYCLRRICFGSLMPPQLDRNRPHEEER